MFNNDTKKSPSQLRRERDRNRRRGEMIEAAEKLFQSQGFEKTMMDQVAFGAGYSKATIYKYFHSKDDLYLAVAAVIFERLCTNLEKALNESEKEKEVQNMLFAYLRFVRSQPSYAEIINDMKLRIALAKIMEMEIKQMDLTENEQNFRFFQQKSFELLLTGIKTSMVDESTFTLALAISAFIPGFMKELVLRENTKVQSEKESEDQLKLVFNLMQDGIRYRNQTDKHKE